MKKKKSTLNLPPTLPIIVPVHHGKHFWNKNLKSELAKALLRER